MIIELVDEKSRW